MVLPSVELGIAHGRRGNMRMQGTNRHVQPEAWQTLREQAVAEPVLKGIFDAFSLARNGLRGDPWGDFLEADFWTGTTSLPAIKSLS